VTPQMRPWADGGSEQQALVLPLSQVVGVGQIRMLASPSHCIFCWKRPYTRRINNQLI